MVDGRQAPLLLGLFALAFLGTSCTGVTPAREINEQYSEIINQRLNQYTVKAGDAVTVRIYEHDGKLSEQVFTVLPDGRSDPFFLDGFRFGGKTIPELQEEIRRLYVESLEVTPVRRNGVELPLELSIYVTPSDEVVYVNGQVERLVPEIPLRIRMTLGEALAHAGGYRITADSNYALLSRPYGHPVGTSESYRVDLNERAEQVILLPGDRVYVPRNFLATIVAYLREYVFGVIPGSVFSGAALSGAAF